MPAASRFGVASTLLLAGLVRDRVRGLMPGRLIALIALVLCIASLGCGSAAPDDTSAPGDDDAQAQLVVPDVSNEDGDEAVADIEDARLTATLADANDDPGFDSGRDATGCEVTDQDPAADAPADEGDEVTVTVDCAQVDWENQEGAQWGAFDDAYQAGFDDGCQQLFDESPDGSLYEDDTEYTAVDCQNENPGDASDASEASDVPGDVPDDPEDAGTELGQLDGCQSLFEQDSVISLNYGETSYAEDDCPVSAVAAAPSRSTHKSTKSTSTTTPSAERKQAGEICGATEDDGTPLTLDITKGSVKCSGALALFNEWLRRAPNEGQGSGGALRLYGWTCVGALATQAPRLGSCSREGSDPAAFEIREADDQ